MHCLREIWSMFYNCKLRKRYIFAMRDISEFIHVFFAIQNAFLQARTVRVD